MILDAYGQPVRATRLIIPNWLHRQDIALTDYPKPPADLPRFYSRVHLTDLDAPPLHGDVVTVTLPTRYAPEAK